MRKERDPGDSAILNEAAVRVIRRKAREGTLSVSEAALFYGVGFEAIRRVVRRETWRHVADEPPPGQTPAATDLHAQAARLFAMQEGLEASRPPEGLARLQEGITAKQAQTAANLELQREAGVSLSPEAQAFLAQTGIDRE